MFKEAEKYTPEEMLRNAQEFFGGQYWAWFTAARRVVGEEKTREILVEIAESFTDPEIQYIQSLWGREFANLKEIAQCMDVIHRTLAYEGLTPGTPPQWTWENENKGYEQIGHCPIYSATPEEFKKDGPTDLCTVYCRNIGEKVYARLDATIRQDTYLSRGESCCGFHIERKPVRSGKNG
jgi:hypothetical protein